MGRSAKVRLRRPPGKPVHGQKPPLLGTQVLKRAPGPFPGVLPEALAALDDATLARLDSDLGKLLALLQTDERAADIPLAQM